MSRELSQAKLEVLVNGTPQLPNVVFYEQAVLDHEASNRAGRRIYVKTVFIKITQPGVTDWVSYKAQKADFAAYPEEYDYFLGNKQGTRTPGIEIIPNLDIAHLQELIDIGLAKIPKLAEALQVPEHLEYARQAAIAINSVLKETGNANEEESIQEVAIPAEELPQTDRQDHPVDLQRSAVPDSPGIEEDHLAEGLQTSGRFDGGQDLIDNWKAEITYN
jgi:hypothetical protein